MRCPLDKSDMIVVEHKKIELDYCLECAGVWFDCGELELLLGLLNKQGAKSCTDLTTLEKAKVTESKRKCPVCGRNMDKVWIGRESKVLIDSCPIGDGLWFDGGELNKVLTQTNLKTVNEDVIAFLGETFKAGKKGIDPGDKKK
jgi:Zn-finger nucleic acid-binding protein